MADAWDAAMRRLSDLELRLIMQGAKNGTLKAMGDPGNSYGAGIKAAMELNRRDAQGIAAGTDETPTAAQPEGQEPGPKDAPDHAHNNARVSDKER